MNFNTVKVWTIGVSLLSVLLLLGTVFLGAKPMFDDAADMNAEREDVDFRNDKLRAEVQKLRVMQAGLPATRAEIAAFQVGIPTNMNVDQLLLDIAELADKHGLIIKMSGLESPTSFAENAPEPTAPPTPTPAPEGEAGKEPEPLAPGEVAPAEGPSSDKKPGGIALLEEFYVLNLEMEMQGTYSDAVAFVEELQVESERHFLLFAVEYAGFIEDKDGTVGMPDEKVGDVMLKIKGSAYVLKGIDQPEVDGDVAPEPELPMPKPGANDNPFMPIEGQPAP